MEDPRVGRTRAGSERGDIPLHHHEKAALHLREACSCSRNGELIVKVWLDINFHGNFEVCVVADERIVKGKSIYLRIGVLSDVSVFCNSAQVSDRCKIQY